MANFCPNCGGKVNPDDRFCKNCGANLIGAVEVPKEELKPERPPALVQIPSKPSKPSGPSVISNFLGVLIGLGIVFLVLYSLGCAMGMFPDTQDQMCQSIHQAFSGGGGTSGGGGGGTTGGSGTSGSKGCTPTGCPSSAPWYGCGSCWTTSNLCHSRGTSILTDDCSVCRKCP